MKKIITTIFFPLLIFSNLVFLPITVAAETTEYTGIASFAGCSGKDCTACHVVNLVNEGTTWLIGMFFVLFAVLVAIAGIKLVTAGGNAGALSSAKDSFINAIVGLIIVLSAWLIVDTIMRGLLKNDGLLDNGGEVTGWLAWSEVECYEVVKANEYDINIPDHTDADISMVSVDSFGQPEVGTNCSVPDNLVTIPGTSFRAQPETAKNFIAMQSAAAKDGITLRITSAYRSEDEQVEIWTRKGCKSNPSNCSGKAARPCSLGGNGSNHSSGVALDISVGSSGSPTFNWLKANGGRYGFYNKLGAGDPFHWSPSGR